MEIRFYFKSVNGFAIIAASKQNCKGNKEHTYSFCF